MVYATQLNSLGIQFPSVNNDQIFQVNIEDLTVPTPIVYETNILRFKVMNSLAVTGGRISYVNNINEENLIKFNFRLTNPIAASGKITIEFPTITPTVTLNNNDLYSGFTFNQNVPCVVTVNGATDSTYKCLFTPGTNHYIKPAKIVVSGTNARSANDQIVITLSVFNGPTSEIWTSARIYSQDASLNYLDFYSLDHLVYHASTTITTLTAPFPTSFSNVVVQNAVNVGINVAPTVPITLTSANHRLRFKYNSFFYGGATQAMAGGHTQELWSTSCSFITFGSNPGVTPRTFTVNNMKNPMSNAAFTSTLEMSIVTNGVITNKISYADPPFPAWTLGAFTATSVIALGLSRNEMTRYTVGFTSNKDIPAGGNLDVIFPAGYTLNPLGCYVSFSGTCSVNTGTQTIQIVPTNLVPASTAITVTAIATNPAAAGATAAFTAQSYIGTYASAAIAINNAITGVTIAATSAFISLHVLDRKNDTIPLQDRMHGPLTFHYVPTNTLPPATGFTEFRFAAGLWVPPEQTISTGINLNCFWDNLAAPCFGIITAGNVVGYTVYTPYETAIPAGVNVTVTITSTRYQYIGFRGPLTGPGIYVVNAIDSAGATQTNDILVPMTGFWYRYIGSRITTKTEQSIVYLGFSNHYPVNSSAITMKTQIIVEFPTVDISGNNIFPVDLGKGIANG